MWKIVTFISESETLDNLAAFSVCSCDAKLIEQFRHTDITNRFVLAAGSITESKGNVGFAVALSP